MKIGIFSDIHRNPQTITEALDYFRTERVDVLVGAGDLSNSEQSLIYVLTNIAQSKIPAILFPGSHERVNDWQQAFEGMPEQVVNGLVHRRISLGDFELVTMPGSESVAGGQFLMTNEGQSRMDQRAYLCSVQDLDSLIEHPEKTILACHNPPKFTAEGSTDRAFFGEIRGSVLPGYDATYYNLILGPEDQIPTQRENRGYAPFADKIRQLFPTASEKVICGHFHESTGKATDREGRKVEQDVWTDNLYHLASNLDFDRVGVWETRTRNGRLEVKYKNVNLGDFI